MQTAKQEFQAAYSAAREAESTTKNWSSVHAQWHVLCAVSAVIEMKQASAQIDLHTRLAQYKSTKQWLAGDDQADDDYIDD